MKVTQPRGRMDGAPSPKSFRTCSTDSQALRPQSQHLGSIPLRPAPRTSKNHIVKQTLKMEYS